MAGGHDVVGTAETLAHVLYLDHVASLQLGAAGAAAFTITAGQDIKLSAAQGTITLEARKIDVKATGDASIGSGAAMKLDAHAAMTIKGALVNIN